MDNTTAKQTELSSAINAALGQNAGPAAANSPKRSPKRVTHASKNKGVKRPKSPDPVIFTSRNVLMQALLDAVNNGYTHHTTGSTPVAKIEQTIAVYDMNYHAFANRNERARRKRHGLGNVNAIMIARGNRVEWWLLSTPPESGRHPIHSTDNLGDAMTPGQRVEVDGYELVRQPKPGTDTSKLTWRMTEKKYQQLRDHIIDTVRSRSHNGMHNLLYQLFSMPGFSGVRRQVGKLVALYRGEIKRAGIKDALTPPRRLPYLRRIPHTGLSVRQVKQK